MSRRALLDAKATVEADKTLDPEFKRLLLEVVNDRLQKYEQNPPPKHWNEADELPIQEGL